MKKLGIWFCIIGITMAMGAGVSCAIAAEPSPTELPVVSDKGTVDVQTPAANTMTWNATQPASVILLSSGNVGSSSTLNVNMQDGWRMLAKVEGSAPTQWYGTVNCPYGTLVWESQGGLHIGPQANVNVNNFVATTLAVSENNFLSGTYDLQHLSDAPYSQILNEGTVVATGSAALIASAVENRGTLIARSGTITLASGNKATVSFDYRGLIHVEVTEKTDGQVLDLVTGAPIKDAVTNSNTGTVDAHRVVMTAQTAEEIFENAVNQNGAVKATRFVNVNGVIKITADNNVAISGAMETDGGDIEVTSEKNVTVSADLTAQDGNITMKADSDKDGTGKFTQDAGTIEVKGSGDVRIDGSEAMTIGNIKTENGSVFLAADSSPTSIVATEGSAVTSDYLKAVGPVIFINSDSTNTHIVSDDTVYISNASNNDGRITLEGNFGRVNYLAKNNITLQTDFDINTSPGAIISGNGVTLIGRHFGSSETPVNTDASITIIRLIYGDMYIAQSQGIGTSILICGPPDDGFGAIIYNEETNLSIIAEDGSITVGDGVTIYSSASSINLETFNKYPIIINGSVKAPEGTVRLWTCGIVDLTQADEIVSKDGGFIYNTEDYVAVSWDAGAGTNNWADANNWSGNVVPNTNAYQVTIDYDGATVTTVADYTIGELIIGETNTCSLILGGSLTLDDADPDLDGSLTMGANGSLYSSNSNVVVTVDGDVTGDGTINMAVGTFQVLNSTNFGGDTDWTFYNLTFGDGETEATTTKAGSNSITVRGDLTISLYHTLGTTGSETWSLSWGESCLSGITKIAGGYGFNIALTSAGTVYTWGIGENGQLGTNSYAGSSVPVMVLKGEQPGTTYLGDTTAITQIAAG